MVVRCGARRIIAVRPGRPITVWLLGIDRREPTVRVWLTRDGFTDGCKTMAVTEVACPVHRRTHSVDAARLFAMVELQGRPTRPVYVDIETVTAKQ